MSIIYTNLVVHIIRQDKIPLTSRSANRSLFIFDDGIVSRQRTNYTVITT